MYAVTCFKKTVLAAVIACCAGKVSAQVIADTVYKKNIAPIARPLQHLMQLQPRMYEYRTDRYKHFNLGAGLQFGFISDNMSTVYPHLVKPKYISYMYAKNTFKGIVVNTIDTQSLIPVLVASIQELYAEVEKLKAEIKALRH
ncbi:MAG: hypothetical protein RL172_1491 [Bacteroidota bacterium]|jgi:hypothetical protein